MELHQILDNQRVNFINLLAEREQQIHANISAHYQKDIEPDQIIYAIRVLNDMVDRCDTVEETIELLTDKHKELCQQRAKH